MNASNINRYRVLFKGSYGWISEKVRGSEEVMLTEEANAGTEQKDKALQELVEAVAAAANISDLIVWDDVSSLKEAVKRTLGGENQEDRNGRVFE